MRATAALSLLLGVGAVGCGGGADGARVNLSGAVTFGTTPVKTGRIYFDPVPNKNEGGLQGYADIKDGKYDTKAPDCKGPTPGEVMVRIDGFGDPIPGYPGGKPLFANYPSRIEVTGTATEDFSVSTEAAIKLPAKPPEAP